MMSPQFASAAAGPNCSTAATMTTIASESGKTPSSPDASIDRIDSGHEGLHIAKKKKKKLTSA